MEVIKVENIKDLKILLDYWEISQDFEKQTVETWGKQFPLYYRKIEGNIVCSYLKPNEGVISAQELVLNFEKIMNNTVVYIRGWEGMPNPDIIVGGVTPTHISSNKEYYKTDRGIIPVSGTALTPITMPELEIGDTIKIHSKFGGYTALDNKVFTVRDMDTMHRGVYIRAKDGEYLYIPCDFVEFISKKKEPKKVVKMEKKVEEVEVDINKIYNTVVGFYDNDISGDFRYFIEKGISNKLKYLNTYFQKDISYDITPFMKEVEVTHHEKYQEMLEKLKSLDIDVDSLKNQIIENKIFWNGKDRKVTSVLASEKKGRYEDVYKSIFPEKIEISIDPYEMVTCSHNYNDKANELGGSCFSQDGCYHSAVWAYIGCNQTFILKIKDSEGKTSFRMWISVNKSAGAIIFGRKYGTISNTQYKYIRLYLEKLLAEELGEENRWQVGNYSVEVYNQDEGVYWDEPSRVAQLKSLSDSEIELHLGDSRTSSGETGEGDFWDSRRTCYDCGCSYDEEAMTYVESINDYVCESCLYANYFYDDNGNDPSYAWTHSDNSIYIEDKDFRVHEDEAGSYYNIDDCYYQDLPDDYVIAKDGEIYRIDSTFFCEYSDECYHYTEPSVVVNINGEERIFAKENLIESDYHFCPECNVWYSEINDDNTCVKCGEEI